jgi:hypothetical protein
VCIIHLHYLHKPRNFCIPLFPRQTNEDLYSRIMFGQTETATLGAYRILRVALQVPQKWGLTKAPKVRMCQLANLEWDDQQVNWLPLNTTLYISHRVLSQRQVSATEQHWRSLGGCCK